MDNYTRWQIEKGYLPQTASDTGDELENGEEERQRKEDIEEQHREWEFENLFN